MKKNIKIKATVDGVVREVELDNDQLYTAELVMRKAIDRADVDGYIEDWFPDDYGDHDNYDELLATIKGMEDAIAVEYRERMDNDDTWFYTMRDVVASYVSAIEQNKWDDVHGTLEFDTYPNMTNDDGSENLDYDNTLKLFTVPAIWAMVWIKKWTAQEGMTVDQFKDWYDWDDTLRMYEDAHRADMIISERIAER